jgi:hypothetical protein
MTPGEEAIVSIVSGVGLAVALIAAGAWGYYEGSWHQAKIDARATLTGPVATTVGTLSCFSNMAEPPKASKPPPDCVHGHGCRPFPGLVLPVCDKAKDVCCKAGDAACIKELPKP